MKSESSKKRFIDLFAGCGGLSLGLMLSGWRGLFAIEKEELAFTTLKHNLIDGAGPVAYSWPKWLQKSPHDIKTFLNEHDAEISRLRGKVELVAGGPPCQGFSTAGKRNIKDPRNLLPRYYLEFVESVRPTFVLLENVRGMAIGFSGGDDKTRSSEKRPLPFSEWIKKRLEHIGYHVYPLMVMAVDFGVPQLRPRYIVIGIRAGGVPRLPDAYISAALENGRRVLLDDKGLADQPVTVREAISDLRVRGKALIECEDSQGFLQAQYKGPETHYQEMLHGPLNGESPNSLRLAHHRPETIDRFAEILKCRRGVQLSREDRERLGIKKHCIVPLDGAKPSHTLTTLPDDLIHYSEPRILTVRESARLQSMPDWFEFKGKYTTGGDRRKSECPRYTQVGNAVPTFLAEALGIALSQIAEDGAYRSRRKWKTTVARLGGQDAE